MFCRDMDKLKSETKVTRLTELDVEKNTYLQELRRLQKEMRLLQEENQTLRSSLTQAPNAENGKKNLKSPICNDLIQCIYQGT